MLLQKVVHVLRQHEFGLLVLIFDRGWARANLLLARPFDLALRVLVGGLVHHGLVQLHWRRPYILKVFGRRWLLLEQ
jgi:hypothetical protein